MKRRIVLFAVIGGLMAAVAKEAVVVYGAANADVIERTLNHDPSLVAVSNEVVSATNPKPFLERWRIVSDLNGDGIKDLILSDEKTLFGNAGGAWWVYVQTNSLWSYRGSVGFHPDAFALEKTYRGVNVWSYWHMSGEDGIFECARIVDGKLEKGPAGINVVRVEDGDCIFTRMYEAIFAYPSTQPFRLESSETSTNGVVSWKFVRDERTPCRKSEVYELKRRVVELEKRANEAESQLRRTKSALEDCTRGMFEFDGITLGARWDGGATNRFCTEVFPGFTNLTVVVDSSNFVSAIRLTRQGRMPVDTAPGVNIHSAPTDEEQKIIHQIENRFNIRLQDTTFQKKRVFYWANPFLGNWVKASFAREGETESRIEMRYSRNLGESPLP